MNSVGPYSSWQLSPQYCIYTGYNSELSNHLGNQFSFSCIVTTWPVRRQFYKRHSGSLEQKSHWTCLSCLRQTPHSERSTPICKLGHTHLSQLWRIAWDPTWLTHQLDLFSQYPFIATLTSWSRGTGSWTISFWKRHFSSWLEVPGNGNPAILICKLPAYMYSVQLTW